MALTAGLIIADRYALQAQLGVGAMGEVWRAEDTRFEARSVAVKFLREDDVLREDAQNRERLLTALRQHASQGPLTVAAVGDSLGSALAATDPDALNQQIAARFGAGPIEIDDVVLLFDRLAADPAFNENARMRAKLRRLFRDEANAVANLRHDNIVSIFDYGDHEGSPYLVMDYIEGRTLQQIVQGQESLPQARRLRLMEDLCAGLGYAHKRKLVHRDIKPANLIIDSGTQRLKILDFGVVRRVGSESTVGLQIGTFCYMSPEQTRGAATLDHRSDIFSVGVVFYEMLSGKKAFPPGRGVGDLIVRIQRSTPARLAELVPGISQSIQDIIDRAIAKQPEQRYQDLDLMAADIANVRAKIEADETSLQSVPNPDSTLLLPPADVRARARQARTVPPAATPPPVRGGETIQMKAPSLRPPLNVLNRRDPAPASPPSGPPPPQEPRVTVPGFVPPPLPPALGESEQSPAPPPLPPSLPGTAATVPTGVTRKPRNPLVFVAAVAAAVIIAVIASVMSRRSPDQAPVSGAANNSAPAPRSGDAPPPTTDVATQQTPATTTPSAPEPTPATTTPAGPEPLPSTTTPAAADEEPPTEAPPTVSPAPADLRAVAIDIRPWARVRIVPAGRAGPQVSSAVRFAPFTADLEPGDYVLECENDGLNRAARFPLKVAAGSRIQTFTRNMPGFDPAGIVDALLRQD